MHLTALLALLTTLSLVPGDAWQVRSIEGRPLALDKDQVKATAFVFVTNVCPIANAYQPRLRELQQAFEAKGIQFIQVYPIESITAEAVNKHRQEFDIRAESVIDPDQSLAKRLGAKITPEAIVVDRAGRVLYRGRIDDQHAALGKKRPEATQHDLSNALKAIADGQPVVRAETKAVGCNIRFAR